MLFGGGPRGLGMFGNQAAGQGGFLAGMEERMNNPLVAAALGAGGAMLSSEGNLAQAIGAGAGGGFSGFYGAMRQKRQMAEEEERKKLMEQLMARMGGVANQTAASPAYQPANGMFGIAPGLF